MIRSRDHLLSWLLRSCRHDPVIARSVESGKVEVLGLFSDPYDGWFLRAVSSIGTVRTLFVHADQVTREPVAWGRIDEVPWEYWIGDPAMKKLDLGDNPDEYNRHKTNAIRRLDPER